MPWHRIRIARFGGPEVLELAEEPARPDPGPGEVCIKVVAAGTGFTDSFIRLGRYPDFKGPLPFTPGYELVGVVEKARALSCARSRWRRCGRGRLHPARLPYGLPDAHALSSLFSRRDDPRYRRIRHGRYGDARSRASFW